MAPRLEVHDLEKVFTLHVLGGKQISAFAGVNFRLYPGECLHILGPSGVGKSSLLKCLYRTYTPTAGRAVLRTGNDSVDLASAPGPSILALRRHAIGYVSQFFAAIPRVSALSVVAEPLLDLGMKPPEAHRLAGAMLTRLGIPESLWECYPATFSGGERQRVNLARALVAPRELMLLDEPTASLDPARREIVLALLADLKQSGTALVLVLHDPVQPALVDRNLVLREGRE